MINLRAHPRDERRRPQKNDYRTVAQRDRDRILYAPEFRRLASVTQVVNASELQLFHNRLTHSLKVAQLARRLAEKILGEPARYPRRTLARLGGVDPDAAEAAGLAHDIGHPPFGHIAEDEMQAWLHQEGGPSDSFEGNAQTFRILTKLSFRKRVDALAPGLNLSRATLNAVLKYPWRHGYNPDSQLGRTYPNKWGAYACDQDQFDWARQGWPSGKRSLEAEIMDWADDIAYAVHDVEDFYRAGLIPLPRLRDPTSPERLQFIEYASSRLSAKAITRSDCEVALEEISSSDAYLPSAPYRGTRQDREEMLAVSDWWITHFIDAFNVTAEGAEVSHRVKVQVELLKQLTWCFVVESPGLATIQRGQRTLIRRLLTELDRWAEDARESRRLPAQLQEYLMAIEEDPTAKTHYRSRANRRRRSIVDYVASLTEAQTLQLAERLDGRAPASSLEPWLSA